MKSDSSLVYISPVIVFLSLIFSTNNIEPSFTSNFNPHHYLQEHYIEYVWSEVTNFSSDSIPNFQEYISSGNHQSSDQTPSDGTDSPARLPQSNNFIIIPRLKSDSSQDPSPVSVHIRFIHHQSLSDCDPDYSFLI